MTRAQFTLCDGGLSTSVKSSRTFFGAVETVKDGASGSLVLSVVLAAD
jgi:hypothetical protein